MKECENYVELFMIIHSSKRIHIVFLAKKTACMEQGLLFVKPSFNTAPVLEFIKSHLKKHNVKITHHGKMNGAQIAAKKGFESQYGPLVRHSQLLSASDITLSREEGNAFADKFNAVYREAVTAGQVFTSPEACSYLGVDYKQLNKMCERSSYTIRVRRGLFICFLDSSCSDEYATQTKLDQWPVYVINGFFPALADTYKRKKTVINVFVVEWSASVMSWSDFCRDMVGDGDPSLAAPFSLRGYVHANWQELGLKIQPTRSANILHFSQSAFEGLVDRLLWVKGAMLFTDPLGARLLGGGVSAQTAQSWLANPVLFGSGVFDHMSGLGSADCIAKAQSVLLGDVQVPSVEVEGDENNEEEGDDEDEDEDVVGIVDIKPVTPAKKFQLIDAASPTKTQVATENVLDRTHQAMSYKGV